MEKRKTTRVFYIDPQSYLNLSVYDYSLLKDMKDVEVTYYANIKYDCECPTGVTMRKVFQYSDCTSPLAKLLSYTKSMMRILMDARREKPDFIHIQWIRFWPLDYMILLVLHLLGIKVVYTAHNVLPHTRHFGDKTMFRLYYRAVDKIIVHSKRTKQEIIAMTGNARKTAIIHHGILNSKVDSTQCEERIRELRKEFCISDNTVVFSCLGLQNKYKGTDMVFRAWKASEKINKSNCVLLVVGKNENIDYSVIADRANVHIVDAKVSDLDFNAYLRLSSVVLLPYLNISQSGVLFSALQAGIPVLVTDVGGLAEPLEIANVGWNIGQPSLTHLQCAMEKLCSDKPRIDAIRNDTDSFEKVKKAYDWSEISEQTANLYKGLS